MQVRISCETYHRLMPITALENDKNADYFGALYIERKAGITVAIASNRRIAAFERLADADQDGSFFIKFDPGLYTQCKNEIAFKGYIDVVANEPLKFVTAKTMLGFTVPGNLGIFPRDHLLTHWRALFPKKPITQTGKGGMYWNYRNIAALGASAPSGIMRFPQHIDCSEPVVVRDILDDKWCGLFMPNYMDDEKQVKVAEPATLPEWVKL